MQTIPYVPAIKKAMLRKFQNKVPKMFEEVTAARI